MILRTLKFAFWFVVGTFLAVIALIWLTDNDPHKRKKH